MDTDTVMDMNMNTVMGMNTAMRMLTMSRLNFSNLNTDNILLTPRNTLSLELQSVKSNSLFQAIKLMVELDMEAVALCQIIRTINNNIIIIIMATIEALTFKH